MSRRKREQLNGLAPEVAHRQSLSEIAPLEFNSAALPPTVHPATSLSRKGFYLSAPPVSTLAAIRSSVYVLSIGARSRTVLLELVDHVIEIGIACPEAPSESISATRGDSLAVRDHVELPRLAGPSHGFDFKALLDEGHETRDLGSVVLSRRAVHDLDLHSALQSL